MSGRDDRLPPGQDHTSARQGKTTRFSDEVLVHTDGSNTRTDPLAGEPSALGYTDESSSGYAPEAQAPGAPAQPPAPATVHAAGGQQASRGPAPPHGWVDVTDSDESSDSEDSGSGSGTS